MWNTGALCHRIWFRLIPGILYGPSEDHVAKPQEDNFLMEKASYHKSEREKTNKLVN